MKKVIVAALVVVCMLAMPKAWAYQSLDHQFTVRLPGAPRVIKTEITEGNERGFSTWYFADDDPYIYNIIVQELTPEVSDTAWWIDDYVSGYSQRFPNTEFIYKRETTFLGRHAIEYKHRFISASKSYVSTGIAFFRDSGVFFDVNIVAPGSSENSIDSYFTNFISSMGVW